MSYYPRTLTARRRPAARRRAFLYEVSRVLVAAGQTLVHYKRSRFVGRSSSEKLTAHYGALLG